MESSTALRNTRRLTLLMALYALVLVVASPGPAVAHVNPANYVTAITSVRPAVLGLGVTAASDGSSLTITNRTGRTVVVLGYEGEPYLKITAHGVWRNTLSPATYLNVGRTVGKVPDSANPDAPPEWQQVSGSNTYQFHDHRIDWMGQQRPPVVVKHPNEAHLIKRWSVSLLVDDTPVTVQGTLSWSPTGFRAMDVVFAAVCGAVLIAFGVAIALDARRKPVVDADAASRSNDGPAPPGSDHIFDANRP